AQTRAVRAASVSAGTPQSHLLSNASSTTQSAETFNCNVAIRQTRWLPMEVTGSGTLILDTYGSYGAAVLSLFRTNSPALEDIVRLECNVEPVANAGWSLISYPVTPD